MLSIKSMYAIGFFVCGLLLSILLPKAYKSKNEIGKPLFLVLLMIALVCFSNFVQVLTLSERISEYAYLVFFVSLDWLCFFGLFFSVNYTDICKKHLASRKVIVAILTADSINLLLNPFFGHMYFLNPVRLSDGELFYAAVHKWPFHIHMGLDYLLLAGMVALLVIKLYRSPRLYWVRYIPVLMAVFVLVAWDLIFINFHSEINQTVFGYAFFGILIYYFALIYIPRSMMEGILAKIVGDMSDAVLFFDMDGKCLYANAGARKYLEIKGSLNGLEAQARIRRFNRKMKIPINRDFHKNCTMEFEDTPMHIEAKVQRVADPSKRFAGCIERLEDHTREINQFEQERYRAMHDTLTGIYNREGFYESVRALLDKSPDVPRLMICFNFKDFKYVNSFFGMEKGNEVLIRSAEEISNHLVEDDIVGRLYGDNFALCTATERFDELTYQEIVRSFSKRVIANTYDIYVHVGIYRIVDPDMDVSVMCDCANLALQTIRAERQNRIAYYDHHVTEQLLHEKTLISEFGPALSSHQFNIYIQPQFSAKGKLLGGEALVRWQHPQKGLVQPGDFIPILEKNGLIYHLDYYVWEEAAKQLAAWKGTDKEDLYLSVNISPRDIYYVDIYSTFTALAKKYEIDPHKLKLEITETAIMQDIGRYNELLTMLHGYGFEVEMDDFGSGYSSLGMLKDIPMDILKIDMSFLSQMQTRKRGRIILSAVIAMAGDLGMPVISEGVETKEQMDLLTEMGCDIFQGFYLAKPMSIADFEKRYASEKIVSIS